MHSPETQMTLAALFSELTDGPQAEGEAFIVNSGDIGLLRSIDQLSAADASRAVNGGATVGAHVAHVRYGLSLMNQWATEGGNPFANARWDEAWKVSSVDEGAWKASREGLRDEVRRWRAVLASPREVAPIELAGMVASVAHLAYHLGAIRQIAPAARGPKDGTFT